MNQFKTAFLIFLMTILLFVGQIIGGRQGFYFALIFVLLMNFISYWYSDKIVLHMYGASQVDPRCFLQEEIGSLLISVKNYTVPFTPISSKNNFPLS